MQSPKPIPTIEARVAYAGPRAGTAAALVCAVIGLAWKCIVGISAVFRRDKADLEHVTPANCRLWAVRYSSLVFFLGAAIFFTQRLLHGTVGGL